MSSPPRIITISSATIGRSANSPAPSMVDARTSMTSLNQQASGICCGLDCVSMSLLRRFLLLLRLGHDPVRQFHDIVARRYHRLAVGDGENRHLARKLPDLLEDRRF